MANENEHVAIPLEEQRIFQNTDNQSVKARITFHNLRYFVPLQQPKRSLRERITGQNKQPKTEKEILKSISGSFEPGKVTAILGPSGGGKTSLLSAIGGLKMPGRFEGTFEINGKEANAGVRRAMSGFVYQEDVMMHTMKVEEVLYMAGYLRTDGKIDQKALKTKVHRVAEILSLEGALKTFIGNSMRKGISGGEKKRAAIGMELMAGSNILLLDECTSGLDTYSAYSVMSTLKKIAGTGATVVTSLHQPSSEIFELIDNLLIMVGGEILYNGPAKEMVSYFAKLGHQCPEYTNPPDYVFMEIIKHNKPEKLRELIEHSRQNQKLEIQQLDDLGLAFKYYPKRLQQLNYLCQRAAKNVLREPLALKAKFGQNVFLGLIIGALYFDVEGRGNSEQLVRNTSGALFFTATNLFIGSSISMMSTFANERPVFVREYASGYYGVFEYFLSKNIVELPSHLLMPLILASISYWMIGYSREFIEYLIYSLFCIVQALVGTAYGLGIASAFEDLSVGLALLPVSILPLMLLGGLLIVNELGQQWLMWIQWISPVQYMFRGQLINYWRNKIKTTVTNQKVDGNIILKNLGVDENFTVLTNFGFLAILLSVSFIVAYAGLRRLAVKSGGAPFLSKSKRLKFLGNKP